MARYSAGVLTGAGSATLPVLSLYGISAIAPVLREVGLTNTTSTAVANKLVFLTTAGTQGAGLVETKHRDAAPAASSTAFTTHTVAPTLGGDLGYRTSLGATVGAGVIWTFGAEGVQPPTGTANGIGVIVENGTGQALQAYVVWDE